MDLDRLYTHVLHIFLSVLCMLRPSALTLWRRQSLWCPRQNDVLRQPALYGPSGHYLTSSLIIPPTLQIWLEGMAAKHSTPLLSQITYVFSLYTPAVSDHTPVLPLHPCWSQITHLFSLYIPTVSDHTPAPRSTPLLPQITHLFVLPLHPCCLTPLTRSLF